jgi:hypothetical protein
MATVTKGKSFISGEVVTPPKLHELVDGATVTGIVNADIAAGAAIAASKLASTLDFSSNTVTLPNTSVTAAMMANTLDLSSKTVTLPNSSASSSVIANSAVTTAKIADATSTTTGVTNAKLRQSAALSVVGNSTNATAAPADIAAATDGHVMRRSGTAIGFGTVATDGIADRAVTSAKLSGVSTIEQKTANYTLVLEDRGKVIEVNSASNLTITVPTNTNVAFATGATVVVTRRGSGDVTIAGASGVTLRSEDNKLKIGKQYAAVALIKIGTDEWLVAGNLKT